MYSPSEEPSRTPCCNSFKYILVPLTHTWVGCKNKCVNGYCPRIVSIQFSRLCTSGVDNPIETKCPGSYMPHNNNGITYKNDYGWISSGNWFSLVQRVSIYKDITRGAKYIKDGWAWNFFCGLEIVLPIEYSNSQYILHL